MFFNRNQIVKVKVRFETQQEWRWFDFGYIHCCDNFYEEVLGHNDIKIKAWYPLEIMGGFEDGHFEVTFPVVRKNLNKFKRQIATFNQYYPIFSKDPEWGAKFYRGS